MASKVMTDRIEVERMAIDVFINDCRFVDYFDLRKMRQEGAFKIAFSYRTKKLDSVLVDEIISDVLKMPYPISQIKGCFMNFQVNDIHTSQVDVSIESICNLKWRIIYLKGEDIPLEDELIYVDSASLVQELPKDEMVINLMFSFEKSEEDSPSDKEVYEALQAYLNEKDQQLPLDPYY